jgi:hypothetical protein
VLQIFLKYPKTQHTIGSQVVFLLSLKIQHLKIDRQADGQSNDLLKKMLQKGKKKYQIENVI